MGDRDRVADPARASSLWSNRLPIAAIAVVAAVLRMIGVSDRSLWIDEAFCVRLSRFGIGELVERSADDNHPPLYFVVVKLWTTVFGTSTLALRMLDVGLGVATICLVYALARRLVRDAEPRTLAASIAAGWIALEPVHVMWSAQVRMYALAGFLAIAACLLLLRALDQPTVWSRWAAWTATAIALCYTHYFGTFVVAAQVLHAVFVQRSRAERAGLLRVIACALVIGVAFAPWLGIVASQSERVAAGWWVPPLTVSRLLWTWSRTSGLLIEDEFTTPSGVEAIAIGGVAIVLALAVLYGAVQRDRDTRLVAWCILLPVIGGVTASIAVDKNVVLARYLIVAEVMLPVLVVALVFSRMRRLAGLLVMVPIAALVVLALCQQVPVLTPQPDAPAAAAWIAERKQPGDIVIVHQFYYWTFLIDGRTSQLQMFAPKKQPIQFLGSALVDDDVVVGPAEIAQLHGRAFIVDNGRFIHGKLPKTFRRLATERFPVWMPPSQDFTLMVTLEEAP